MRRRLQRLGWLLDRLSHWDVLRSFGSTKFAQSTILVPLVGYLILLSSDVSDLFRLTVDPAAWDATSHISRLYWVYFGFWSLSLGSITFAVRCPAEVKAHGSAFDFVEKQYNIMTNARIQGMQEALTGWRGESWDIDHIANEPNRATMRDYFEMLEEARPRSRWAALILYALGGALLLVPTLQTFWLVLRHVIAELI